MHDFRGSRTHIFNIRRSCNARCPFVGKVHKTQHLYLKYFYDNELLVLRCHDEESCYGKCKKYDLSKTVIQAMADASDGIKPDTMHSRESSVQWSADYDEPP